MIFTKEWLGEFTDLSNVSDQDLLDALTAMGISSFKCTSHFQADLPENRPDLHSIAGIARIAAAALKKEFQQTDSGFSASPDNCIFGYLDMDVPAESCLRLSARMACSCRTGPSPGWMQDRLTALGLSPSGLLRDIADYVRLETGMPVRLVDARQFPEGSLRIREAFPGEEVPVSGKILQMDGGEPIISDEAYTALSPAGTEGTLLPEDCRDVFIFCGAYAPEIMKTMVEKAGNPTENLIQNCLNLSPMGTIPALDRACSLLQQLASAEITDGTLDCLNYVPQPESLPMPEDLEPDILTGLKTLGFQEVGKKLEIPWFRGDILNTQDLEQEILRLNTAFSL